ncbi:hypothetical protein AAEH85_21515, partial [Shewanella algae]|uniref:hypothetical protein n=1 Tax=Shewanella algae TaxID=38313 RepID=UPI00313D065C
MKENPGIHHYVLALALSDHNVVNRKELEIESLLPADSRGVVKHSSVIERCSRFRKVSASVIGWHYDRTTRVIRIRLCGASGQSRNE